MFGEGAGLDETNPVLSRSCCLVLLGRMDSEQIFHGLAGSLWNGEKVKIGLPRNFKKRFQPIEN